jgi:outer membrane protein assembly factor BamB
MRVKAAGAALAAVLGLGLIAGCGVSLLGDAETDWIGGAPRARVLDGPLHVRWTERLTPEFGGSYQPVERAVAALDPARDRVYVGSSSGSLWAMLPTGRKLWRFDTGGSIEGQAAVDGAAGELYVGNAEGIVSALRTADGSQRWQKPAGGPIRSAPALSADAVYVATANDLIVALSRADGTELWRYKRDAPDGFSLAGHSGLVLSDGKLFAGFTDGFVVALEAGSGQPAWERDTAIDLEEEGANTTRFVDVDTTPVIVGDRVWIASFSAGLYELSLSSGGVLWKDAERTGIVSIAAAGDGSLILSSADAGVVRFDTAERRDLWRRPVVRGAAGIASVVRDVVLVGENLGGFLALSLNTGAERSRIEAGHGFTAECAVAGHLGFVVSNGGSLYAFALD